MQKLGIRQEAWVKALEGGAYEQAQGRLKDGDMGYCCLGVACDLSGLGYWDGYSNYIIDDTQSDMNLPEQVMEYLGIETDDAEFIHGEEVDGHNSLIGLNDSTHSFEGIAEVIRQDPSMFFTEVK